MNNTITPLSFGAAQTGRVTFSEPTITRALAIGYIVFVYHLCGYSDAIPLNQTALARLTAFCCLGAFAYISGYLLGGRYICENFRDVCSFWKRRFLRVYPMYLLAVILFYFIGLVDGKTCLTAALLVSVLTGEELITLWFANMILLFYLLTPLYLHKYSALRAISLTLLVLGVLGFVKLTLNIIDMRLFEYLPIFVTGIIVSRSGRLRELIIRDRVVYPLVPLWGFMAYGYSIWRGHAVAELALLECARFACIPLFWRLASALSTQGGMSVYTFVSYCSFSLYLLHRIVYGVGIWLYEPIGVAPALIYLWVGLAPCTILVSWGLQAAYDTVLAAACGKVDGRGCTLV